MATRNIEQLENLLDRFDRYSYAALSPSLKGTVDDKSIIKYDPDYLERHIIGIIEGKSIAAADLATRGTAGADGNYDINLSDFVVAPRSTAQCLFAGTGDMEVMIYAGDTIDVAVTEAGKLTISPITGGTDTRLSKFAWQITSADGNIEISITNPHDNPVSVVVASN